MPVHVLRQIYDRLHATLGPQYWWPGDTPWEVAVGAVLTQNTNWKNVEPAIKALKAAGLMSAAAVADLPTSDLAELIRPAGTHNVKARRLQAVARWWLAEAPQAANPRTPLADVRKRLLAVHGVGEETADSILLYALNRTTFVVDAYTRRILQRHGLAGTRDSYATIQSRFMEHLPANSVLYNEYHALLVAVGKQWCRPTPRCRDCPLAWHPRATANFGGDGGKTGR